MKISKILPQILKTRNLSQEAYAGYILEKCTQYISIYLGEESEKMIIPVKVKGNQIFVRATSSGWSHLFLLRKNDILTALKNDFPNSHFRMVLKL